MSDLSPGIGASLAQPAQQDPNEYSFTEIVDFEFAEPVDIENEATPVGQLTLFKRV